MSDIKPTYNQLLQMVKDLTASQIKAKDDYKSALGTIKILSKTNDDLTIRCIKQLNVLREHGLEN